MKNNNSLLRHLPWLVLAIVGACALGVVALRRGEAINALWIVVAAVAIYLVAYRYYSLFIANNVMQLDPRRATPAVVNNDGLDYVPTNKHILFGHHFAAIAGAGPLVGPVLAAQMGYLPGTLWLIAGVVLAGAVQDFMVLFLSTRRNGRSLGDMVREEMGRIPGTIALFGCFLIMIIILAVLALIVVKALAESPWGIFTVMATIPIAMFMGIYMRYIRPGRIGEISIIGVLLLLGSIWLGGQIAADPVWAKAFTFTGIQITWMLIGYGFVAAVLPVWLILAPRDYLSTFLKIGTIIALAIGILITMPDLKMPALTQFIDGTGPVWKGGLFPFLFITIACGAVSGFHALISSGTTPKLLASESHARYIGYGGMLMESFVAIMAMVAASVIEPGVYFAMNSPAAIVGTDVVTVAQTVSSWGFAITPEALSAVAHDIGETTILARAGGAPTLAVGIAQILHSVLPGENTMAFWYHFAILFEALFILTAVDAGTRAGRFMLQDLLGSFVPALKRTESWTANLIATAGCVAMWGYLLYQGVIDPLGGINTLWPLFGISNQMLAGIALMLATVVLIKMKRQRYIWVTMLPAVWLLICTTTAGFIKLFDANPAIGFLSLAKKYSDALANGQILAPAKSIDQMQHVIWNAYTNATLTALFLFVVFSILFYALKVGVAAWGNKERTDKEAPFQAVPDA
ncbi:MAG: carbon starvation protein A [Pseudomonadales bacterium RIFCSPLOWO2_12_60_38]|jgi:carbon starvation protein|uniref:CstA N-terminal domain-containing protein n=3 Tax=Pseudomonas TaxID=286 RepID=A0A3M5W3F3_PSESX|nr:MULTISPECIES: carbon starvation CstA family protein [Pseudomonas]AFJ55130.1 carbon starvation protein CstA [Pseudomonas fluorescens A506]AOS75791.1 carbon starvation protein A [Pseudomonas fluorescens]ETK38432.1 carbon starvation protein A [Pseudomonas fluorescens FH5]MDN5400492.1 carbon starvation protein A [Pseudomonas sp.]MDN5421234.1 carbon starvation protein A [Pseudomonadales bacterium]OHC32919.1 MAG: carbon starvation protein A [Pseudomonadales bacterium RIFCSPLOWO2_12_60_38]OHC425